MDSELTALLADNLVDYQFETNTATGAQCMHGSKFDGKTEIVVTVSYTLPNQHYVITFTDSGTVFVLMAGCDVKKIKAAVRRYFIGTMSLEEMRRNALQEV